VVCALPVLVVLAAPETLQPDHSVSALAAEDAARDAT
jgi:hypothetical protein